MTTQDPRAALRRLWTAYSLVHSAYDGECEHGFGPPATECPNDGCPDRELAEAWAGMRAALAATPPAIDPERLARAIADHDDICSRMAIPECAAAIIAAYEADADA